MRGHLQLGLTLAMAAAAWPVRSAAQCEVLKLYDSAGTANDKFGLSVALSGDEFLVGAPYARLGFPDSGALFDYVLVNGTWVFQGAFTHPQGESAHIGTVLSLDGDRLLSGCGCWPAISDKTNGVWVVMDRLRPDDYQQFDDFGDALALSGDTAVVGAPDHDNANGANAGSAFVFERDPNGQWLQTQELIASDGQANASFGIAVGIDGDTIVIGAENQSVQGHPYAGEAYVFARDLGGGAWSESSRLLPPESYTLQRFGAAVTVTDGLAVVTAPTDPAAAPSGGAVYVYELLLESTWALAQVLLPDNPQNSDVFGCAVSVREDVILIGSRGVDGNAVNAGAAYHFVRESDGVWRQHAKFTASDGQAYDEFGYSVALDGSWAVIGAPYDDDNGTDSGSAYIFRVGPDYSGNGVPDICECPGDIDYSGAVGLSDLSAVLTNFGLAAGQSYESGDIDGDYDVDLADLSALLERYGVVCP